MKMGIVGLPQSGKTTLFSLIAGKTGQISQKGGRKVAIAQVRDQRLDTLHTFYPPAKKVYASVEFLLVPPVTRDPEDRKKAFSQMAETNAVLLVIRGFEDESIYHIDTTVDPLRDIQTIYDEMMLYDLELIERRLVNIEKDRKKKDLDILRKEKDLLESFQSTLEEGLFLHTLTVDAESMKMIKGFNFLTLKPVIILLNVSDDQMKDTDLIEKVKSRYGGESTGMLVFCAPIEKEISELDTDEEKKEFLEDIGVSEPAIDRIIKLSYQTLGYISFFTVGDDEVRAWTLKSGSFAPAAGGVVHSDLERGFIRAEVIKYNDFMEYGGEQPCKKAGKASLKGKDYPVEDGDILNIRFSV